MLLIGDTAPLNNLKSEDLATIFFARGVTLSDASNNGSRSSAAKLRDKLLEILPSVTGPLSQM